MKALTLWEPWASLVAWGVKSVETRSWATPHRGPLAIHAAKRSDFGGLPMLSVAFKRMMTALSDAGMPCQCGHRGDLHGSFGCGFADGACPCYVYRPDWQLGCVIATCELVNVVPVGVLVVPDVERQWGDFSPTRFGWLLDGVLRLPRPVPARGHQQLWTFEP